MTLTSDMSQLGTILGVWAHPDDEVFLSAGLMALARRARQRVVCVTATLGERGTDDPSTWPPEQLGTLRDREQRAALDVLGVSERVRLGYMDGACGEIPPLDAARRIATIIDSVSPATVLTFGPDGMTGHPDHIAVSAWTSLALTFSDCQPRLLQAAVTPEQLARQRPINEALGAFATGYPRTTPAAELAVRLQLDDELLDRKLAALREHASQTREQERRVGTAAYRLWQGEEAFVLAHVPSTARNASSGQRHQVVVEEASA